ncbi:MAG: HD domain-containing protein [Treponema sp.]|nr:HD domain-containing protein [Treponema sp.]
MTLEEAEKELELANILNPGKWINHSKNVAKIARLITQKTNVMDSDFAYICGLMHDIGRRFGKSHIKHTLDGFNYFSYKDERIARICLSHSFPNKIIKEYQGEIDIDNFEYNKIERYLNEIEYDYYDELIQLADSYGSADGIVQMEIRWVDVVIRNGINNYIIEKWKKLYSIKQKFEKMYNIKIEEIIGIKDCPTQFST